MKSVSWLFAAAVFVAATTSCREPARDIETGSTSTKPATTEHESRAGNTSATPKKTLEIATFNVLYELAAKTDGEPRTWADASTLELVGSIEADVVFLQETNEAWQAAIEAAIGAKYPHCRFHAPRRYLPEGLGVCSKYPIVEDETIESAVHWFQAERVVVDVMGTKVQAFNVHLRPAVAGVAQWWTVQRSTRPDRRAELEHLLTRRADLPTLFVGDFNEVPDGDSFEYLRGAGFECALAKAGVKTSTWQWYGANPPLDAQLDHVALDSHFTMTGARVLRGGRSDHEPVTVSFTLPGAQNEGG